MSNNNTSFNNSLQDICYNVINLVNNINNSDISNNIDELTQDISQMNDVLTKYINVYKTFENIKNNIHK
tara:strand:- start:286 stop:492 length:207 start_codon:yes stop_codon:yes gene_type:complete